MTLYISLLVNVQMESYLLSLSTVGGLGVLKKSKDV